MSIAWPAVVAPSLAVSSERMAPSVSIWTSASWEFGGSATLCVPGHRTSPRHPEKRATSSSLASRGSSDGPLTFMATLEWLLLASCGFAELTIPTSRPLPSSPTITLR
jgi:hypothetical protein